MSNLSGHTDINTILNAGCGGDASALNLRILLFYESEDKNMRIPYGYIMENDDLVVCQEKAEIVCIIFDYYLSGASLGKVVDMLFEKKIPSPTGNERWTRAAIDKLLSNAKYIPIIGIETYMNAQFEKGRRCNVDYDKAGAPRKATRYQSAKLGFR